MNAAASNLLPALLRLVFPLVRHNRYVCEGRLTISQSLLQLSDRSLKINAQGNYFSVKSRNGERERERERECFQLSQETWQLQQIDWFTWQMLVSYQIALWSIMDIISTCFTFTERIRSGGVDLERCIIGVEICLFVDESFHALHHDFIGRVELIRLLLQPRRRVGNLTSLENTHVNKKKSL